MKQLTFKEYRNLDLMLFAVFTIVFEAIATFASGRWFYAQPIAISLTLTLTCIVMMRWSGFAAIHAVVGGIVYCMTSGATKEQYMIYCVGNLLGMIGLLLIKLWGKEALRRGPFKLAGFAVITYTGMAVGRGLMSLLFGGRIETLLVYLTTDIISLMFAVIMLMLLRKTDGMIEDQKSYLLRVEREEKANQGYEEQEQIL